MNATSVIIVGNAGGTNVGASLQRAAASMGLNAHLCDARSAFAGPRIPSGLSWRMLGHRPIRLNTFSREVVAECRRYQPSVLIATGLAPLVADSLREIGEMGIARLNYSTDDPWNPEFKSEWFSDALRMYDHVYTVRRSNIDDLISHGCKQVHYLPFGYDESLWIDSAGVSDGASPLQTDVFFAGAADQFRVPYIREMVKSGIRVAVAGDYWHRASDLRNCAVGHVSAAELKAFTRSAPISLCLVRRTNRDGHVMRSFEIPAIGACMMAEDTGEHREIFGEDGKAVRYFRSPEQAAVIAKELLEHKEARRDLAVSAHRAIVNSGNSYTDRLCSLFHGIPAFAARSGSAEGQR